MPPQTRGELCRIISVGFHRGPPRTGRALWTSLVFEPTTKTDTSTGHIWKAAPSNWPITSRACAHTGPIVAGAAVWCRKGAAESTACRSSTTRVSICYSISDVIMNSPSQARHYGFRSAGNSQPQIRPSGTGSRTLHSSETRPRGRAVVVLDKNAAPLIRGGSWPVHRCD
jgi:hypothetical protein